MSQKVLGVHFVLYNTVCLNQLGDFTTRSLSVADGQGRVKEQGKLDRGVQQEVLRNIVLLHCPTDYVIPRLRLNS